MMFSPENKLAAQIALWNGQENQIDDGACIARNASLFKARPAIWNMKDGEDARNQLKRDCR
jgi:hypothetical protein